MQQFLILNIQSKQLLGSVHVFIKMAPLYMNII